MTPPRPSPFGDGVKKGKKGIPHPSPPLGGEGENGKKNYYETKKRTNWSLYLPLRRKYF